MRNTKKSIPAEEQQPLWYKDAIIYELHVRSFSDSDSDGTGDFRGLTGKLDYLQDLGVTAIWLLPFYPSPLRDDGYDISHYTEINPTYGTLANFKQLLREAHRRGIRVITEMVLNHTSDQHPWFQRARRSKPGSTFRDFYVWSDSPEKYRDARIIFKDYESSNWTWDSTAQAYYWHRFYSHQPDLNFDNPQVRKAILRVIDFWFNMGVDGLRFDAVPYLFEREGTNCENLPETYDFIRTIREHVNEKFVDKMFLAEANQWPEDAAAYFGEGDMFHMAYHFPLMPRLFMALRMEDRFPIIDILDQTPSIPDDCQWVIFLRNHDELTLEMVTDEERDYMYRTYAHDPKMRINLGIRRRLAPLLGNHRRRIELLNGLLLSLPGTPVIYYGDEIGMGDNIYLGDRNGVRTPMQWNDGRNAGFSGANPQQMFLPVIIDPEYHYDAVNVEVQQNNPHSMLWWMKRTIALRKRYRAFGHGTLEMLHPDNSKVLAYIRKYGDESILVVANLSRFVQFVTLDLSEYQGLAPVEMFGRTEFPVIGKDRYFLNLGPHSFYWFSLERPHELKAVELKHKYVMPDIMVRGEWTSVFSGQAKTALEDILPAYLIRCRWFAGKGRRVKSALVRETIPVPHNQGSSTMTLVTVSYVEGEAETYLLPLSYTTGEPAHILIGEHPGACLAKLSLKGKKEHGVLYDAIFDGAFCAALLQIIGSGRILKSTRGRLTSSVTRAYRAIRRSATDLDAVSLLKGEQSNTSIIFGETFILKLFRKLAQGVNPDLEIGTVLTDRSFPHIPPVAGEIEYRQGRQIPMQVGILQGYIKNESDAWKMTLHQLGAYYERVMTLPPDDLRVPDTDVVPIEALSGMDVPVFESELIGTYIEWSRLIGTRTAEMHLALARIPEKPAFTPEPFSKLYQRSRYQSMRNLTMKTLGALEQGIPTIPEEHVALAREILGLKSDILKQYRRITTRPITTVRIRCHGDYHLGQLLFTGKDFNIIDFEGEPTRALSERRIKRSPLRDVAGMMRSFDYAALSSLRQTRITHGHATHHLDAWARLWYKHVSATFLKAYFDTAGGAPFIPGDTDNLDTLLQTFLLEKAVYELGYELNNRPDWIDIPLRSIRRIISESGDRT